MNFNDVPAEVEDPGAETTATVATTDNDLPPYPPHLPLPRTMIEGTELCFRDLASLYVFAFLYNCMIEHMDPDEKETELNPLAEYFFKGDFKNGIRHMLLQERKIPRSTIFSPGGQIQVFGMDIAGNEESILARFTGTLAEDFVCWLVYHHLFHIHPRRVYFDDVDDGRYETLFNSSLLTGMRNYEFRSVLDPRNFDVEHHDF